MASEMHQRIKAARLSAKLERTELAELVGKSRAAVHFWEQEDPEKRNTPRDDVLRRIAESTGAPYEWLVDDNSDLDGNWTTTIEVVDNIHDSLVNIISGLTACHAKRKLSARDCQMLQAIVDTIAAKS